MNVYQYMKFNSKSIDHKEITDTQNSKDNTDFLMSERFLDQLNMSEKTRIPLIIKILHPEHKWMYDQYYFQILSPRSILKKC